MFKIKPVQQTLNNSTHCAMAGGAKSFSHALLSARQHVAAGAHCATNQHRLASQLESREIQSVLNHSIGRTSDSNKRHQSNKLRQV